MNVAVSPAFTVAFCGCATNDNTGRGPPPPPPPPPAAGVSTVNVVSIVSLVVFPIINGNLVTSGSLSSTVRKYA